MPNVYFANEINISRPTRMRLNMLELNTRACIDSITNTAGQDYATYIPMIKNRPELRTY